MTVVAGLVGLRPAPERVAKVSCPPYDVIKEGTPLEAKLQAEDDSLFHVTLGDAPAAALTSLRARNALIDDNEPAFYVYEQTWELPTPGQRTGVFLACEVTDYAEHQVIRHEKTFDAKVKGRIALAESTGHTFGPVFLLTRASLKGAFASVKEEAPLYDFVSDFGPGTELTGIASKVWRVPEESEAGRTIQAAIGEHPLYIADGHHRYHAALRNEQTHTLAYVTEEAEILAYDRVVNGTVPFAEVREKLDLKPVEAFATPGKHAFCLHSREGTWLLEAKEVPEDVVGRLDCSILERELYPHLGLSHDQIVDPAHFDYYPESALDEMKAQVASGKYELAVALHPVSIGELMAVADAGLEDPEIVMPEKSTFFAPKILSGLFVYRHARR
ncbi:MAG: DUF1015 family protein [Deltaproteobacteria bacterium]|nr:DUF1015 family protein [Deltaproteobacteria bacterium]